MLLNPSIRDKLAQYAAQVKATMEGMTGSVTIHIGKPEQAPKVEVKMCDVTKAKK